MILNNLNNPIIITGVQRSGTSIIAKIINIGGAFVGKTSEMMENERIRELVNIYINNIVKTDEKGQFPLPNTNELLIPVNWKDRINAVLIKEGYDNNKIWAFKSFTNCQLWPIWDYAYPNAKWIIVRRRTGDIVSSCMKTAYMSAFKDKVIQKAVGVTNEQEGWLWWVHEHEKLFVEMIEIGLNCKIIWPERMINGDYSQIYEMLEWLGLKWDSSIIETINPLLWKDKKERK